MTYFRKVDVMKTLRLRRFGVSLCPSWIHSSIHFIHSFTHSFIPFIRPFISFIHSFVPSFICSLHSSIHPFIHSFIHSYAHSFIAFVHWTPMPSCVPRRMGEFPTRPYFVIWGFALPFRSALPLCPSALPFRSGYRVML